MIGIIGSGNVGANTAFFLAEQNVGPIVIYDIQEGLSAGKSLDLMEAAPIRGYKTWIRGTDNLEEILACDVVIITAGSVRAPGMKREELFRQNKNIIVELAEKITQPETKVLIITEPVDLMTTVFSEHSPLQKKQILGLGCALDATRLRYLLAEKLGVSMENISTQVFGRHSDDMIILPSYCSVSGIGIEEFLNDQEFADIVSATKKAGSLIVELAQRASAYYGPSVVAAEVAAAIVTDSKQTFTISQILDGQLGVSGVALSLPAIVGAKGIAGTVIPQFNDKTRTRFQQGAEDMKSILEDRA